MAAFNKILVPVDFSEASKAALKYACQLADATSASLCVLHTYDRCPVHQQNEVCYLPQDYLERLEENAHKSLENVLSAEEKTRYRATLVLRQGNAAQEILACLNEQPDIDLIVMATHGRGGVARLMMGSVADKIVRAAPCPVVTLRIPGAGESETTRAA